MPALPGTIGVPKRPRLNLKLLLAAFLILLVVLLIFKPPDFMRSIYTGLLEKFALKGATVAQVNGQKILKSEYNRRLEDQKYFYENVSKVPEERLKGLDQRVLEELIAEKLLLEFAEKNGIEVTGDEIRQRIADVTVNKNHNGDWKAYEETLKKQYKTDLDQVITNHRLEILKERIKALQPSKHLWLIWVGKDKIPFGPQEEEEANRINGPKIQKANAILELIKNSQNADLEFSTVAMAQSEHPETAKNGGDVGVYTIPPKVDANANFPDVKPVFDALNELNEGEIKLYEGWTGYGIARVTDVIEGPLENKSFEDWYRGLRESANVEIYIDFN